MDAEVIVVGGGPSGVISASRAASLGFSVKLLEKLSFPRERICAGLINQKCLEEYPFIHPFIDTTFNSMQIYSPHLTSSCFLSSPSPIFAVLKNRHDLDNFLLKQAHQTGVEVCNEYEVENVKINKKKTSVITNQGTFHSDLLIGADSMNSIVARRLNIGLKYSNHIYGISIGQEFPLSSKKMTDFYGKERKLLFFFHYSGLHGISKIIPKQKSLYISLSGSLFQIQELKELFSPFIKFVQERNLIPIIDLPLDPQLGVTPLNIAKDRFYGPRTMLVGEAGGFCSPTTTLGLYYAFKSGELASQAVKKYFGFPHYAHGIVPPYSRLVRKNISVMLSNDKIFRDYILLSEKRSDCLIHNCVQNSPIQSKMIDFFAGKFVKPYLFTRTK